MWIRLTVHAPSDAAYVFDHPGPIINIGRDPEGELALDEAANQGVSWNHARIELTSSRAFVLDVGSKNGTQLNDQPIQATTAIREGDSIRLGRHGPTLEVSELDIGSSSIGPRRTGTKRATNQPKPAGGGSWKVGLAVGVLLLGLVGVAALIMYLDGPSDSDPPTKPTTHVQRNPKSKAKDIAKVHKDKKDFLPTKDKTKVVTPPAVPSIVSRGVGSYVAEKGAPPSVLLERQQAPDPWGRLRVDNPIRTDYYLVSLPGYRSKVQLDGGFQLTLWGNLPEFAPIPPVLESAILLHAPDPGIQLDFTLDRGRVHLASPTSDGEVRVRVRFHEQIWDVTLVRPETEVVLELWGFYPPSNSVNSETPAARLLACMGLFAKGPVRVQSGEEEYELPDGMHSLVWANNLPQPNGPRRLSRLPSWWTNEIDPQKSPEVADMMASLVEFNKILDPEKPVLDVILTQVRESSYAPTRALGVLFLGAMDALPQVMVFLEERQYAEVRAAAALALRHWMSRSGDHGHELERLFQKNGYTQTKAKTLIRLLRGFAAKDAADQKTLTWLVGLLNHENLAIRELAYRNLSTLTPEAAVKANYDPTSPSEERKEAMMRLLDSVSVGTP